MSGVIWEHMGISHRMPNASRTWDAKELKNMDIPFFYALAKDHKPTRPRGDPTVRMCK